ncbi:Hsp20/alpha crystallin family protein [Lentibacillus juripiscarius]|uniref:Hsp20/alpha crystallin family protein n=1 Tax=Lentibacillus juripiscarius TaxID=257446 RepID=A0ABW5V3G5_9BACI
MDPFKQMADWRKNMDHFFGEQFWNEFDHIVKPTIPQINIYQYDHELICVASIPGLIDLNKVDIYVDYATLELKGVIDITYSGGTVVQDEILQGVFDREVTLPFPVRKDKVHASYRNGLLIIHLHRLISDESSRSRVNIQLDDDD